MQFVLYFDFDLYHFKSTPENGQTQSNNSLSVFDLFVGLTLKRLIKLSANRDYVTKPDGIRATFRTLSDIYDGALLAVFAKFSI